MDNEYQGEERRLHQRLLTEDELAAIKTQILESIYADIGKSVVKKIIWVSGSVVAAAFAWLVGSGHIK